MQKSKQKRKLAKEPQAEEDFGVEECYCEIVDLNESLIDDLCYATERIEKLENGFIKGIVLGSAIIGIIWILSLI
jgi:hypothetical protein